MSDRVLRDAIMRDPFGVLRETAQLLIEDNERLRAELVAVNAALSDPELLERAATEVSFWDKDGILFGGETARKLREAAARIRAAQGQEEAQDAGTR